MAGFYAGQVARQWSAMKNDENFNMSIRMLKQFGSRGNKVGEASTPGRWRGREASMPGRWRGRNVAR